MDDLSKSLSAAFAAISASPWIFFAALAFVTFAIWKAFEWAYSTRLANSKSIIEAQEKLLGQRNADAVIAMEASTRSHAQRREDDAQSAFKPDAIPESGDSAISLPSGDTVPEPDLYVSEQFTPDVAMAAISGKTILQANAALSPYLGRRMIVEGEIVQVSELPSELAIFLRLGIIKSIYCYFKDYGEELRQLSIDDRIRIDGRIVKVDSLGVELNDCRRLPLLNFD
ncbi:hypothetical protein [Sphingomonas faeni]|uniref:hypothetical protein n=1 Tax=Sphingomonas faeni TaxID=185950 RepID=UPI0027D79924|nr:hypothetical protein [Sphingomonas faeni]